MKYSLAENIGYFRTLINITQKELAKKMNVSNQAISHWETGYSEPSIQQLIQLADIFDTTIDELVGRTQ